MVGFAVLEKRWMGAARKLCLITLSIEIVRITC